MDKKSIAFIIKILAKDSGISHEEMTTKLLDSYFAIRATRTTTINPMTTNETLCKAYFDLCNSNAADDDIKKLRRSISAIN